MKKNITSFQIGVLIFFMCFGLYEGIANVSLFSSTEQDAWLSFYFQFYFL